MSFFHIKCYIARGIGKVIDLDHLIASGCKRYVLAYHRVLPKEEVQRAFVQSAMWISPETFESQVQWMQRIGQIVDYRDILNFQWENKRPLFALTFDDGWRDNYQYAFPILKKYNLPAIIFLVTSAIENSTLFWPDEFLTKTDIAIRGGNGNVVKVCLERRFLGNLRIKPRANNLFALAEASLEYLKLLDDSQRIEELDQYYKCIGVPTRPITGPILSWDEIIEMKQNGISFGSHTHTHRIIKRMPVSLIEEELQISKQVLESHLGEPIDSFCYPNARYNQNDAASLSKCGYRYGFKLDNAPLRRYDNPFYIPRILVYEDIMKPQEYFMLRLLGIPSYKGA